MIGSSGPSAASAGLGKGLPSAAASGSAPPLIKRLACMVYEAVLLFGVLMVAGYVFSGVTQQRHALQWHLGMQIFLFVVLGIYFVWFWTQSGQTLAMKTWRIKLLDCTGHELSKPRAAARYLAAWLWFLPPLAMATWLGPSQGGILFAAWVVCYAASCLLHPSKQYWHDLICGTRLVALA